jgi:hypothetical protein
MSVIGAGFARADIPPEPPPSKGCGIDGAGAGMMVAAVIVGLFVLLILRRRAARGR